MDNLKQYLSITPQVQKALDAAQPVVALESTIISHGMPYPQNLETARRVEAIVRENGALPATLAILGGKLCIGLADNQLEYLGKKGSAVHKASRRDIPVLLARGGDGATTVAATMILAALAGIGVFATDGIGGVHRGAETTMDISADLEELARTGTIVVCAGAKSILDLGLTLEYLETKGVPVLGYGTGRLPAFFTRESEFEVDCRVDTPGEVAAIYAAKQALGLAGGVLLANPIPEEHSVDAVAINDAIRTALVHAEQNGIRGRDTTPFLLGKIHELTAGKSLEANIQLAYNNAKLAAQIACELAKLPC